MKSAAVLLWVLLAVSPVVAAAQCKDIVEPKSATQISFSFCTAGREGTALPAKDDELVIEAGGGEVVTKVLRSKAGLTPGTQTGELALEDPAKAQENMLLLVGVDTGKVKILRPVHLADDGDQPAGEDTNQPAPEAPLVGAFDVQLQNRAALRNFLRYDWSIGPATNGEDDAQSSDEGTSSVAAADDSTGDSTNQGALRFRLNTEYARGGLFGARKMVNAGNLDKPEEKRPSLWQTTASLSIDTTDQSSSDFVDNNQLSVGVGLTNLSLGPLWMHGTAGVEANVEKAFHNDTQNVDGLVSVSGWVPPLRSLTLFSKSDFIAAPLKFKASYGYRKHDDGDESTNGRVLTANATYNLYLFDDYQVSFDATWTHNNLDEQPANVPSTQRLYKATIAYLQPDSTFKVLTSIEDGSAGVMLREVRQYFVGIALSRLNLGGPGGG